MNGNLNAAKGILDGFTSGLDLIDRRDAKARGMELQQRQDAEYERGVADREKQSIRNEEEYQYAKERRGVTDGRSDELYSQQQEDRGLALEDRDRQIKRQETQDKHQAKLMPIQLQAARTQAATAETNRKLSAQQAKNAEASGVWQQATVLAEGGDFEGSYKAIEKLGDLGYDIEGMSEIGADVKAQETVSKLMKGELDYGSEEMRELSKKMLTPSLVQSGRDPEKYEIQGIMPTNRTDENGDPTFTAVMMDKESGKFVPFTINQSSDPDDPVTEITQGNLMRAAQGYIEGSKNMGRLKLQAIGAKLGHKAVTERKLSKNDQLANEKIQAQIDKLKAETREVTGEQQVPLGGSAGAATEGMQRLFQESYSDHPRVGSIAQIMQEDPEFDVEKGIIEVAEIKRMAGDKKYENHTSVELYSAYKKQKEIDTVIAQTTGEKTTNFLSQYPNMSESDQADYSKRIDKIVEQYVTGKTNEIGYSKRIQELHDRMAKKQRKNNPTPQEHNPTDVDPNRASPNTIYGQSNARPSPGSLYSSTPLDELSN